MSIRDGDHVPMNAMTDIDAVHRFARTLEDAEAKRLGVRIADARVVVARKLRTSPGTLENIRRLRTKTVPAWLMARIRAEFVSFLQSEVVRLEHEITIARQTGAPHSDDDLVAVQTHMEAVREVLKGAAR
jgi:hypothetical protein